MKLNGFEVELKEVAGTWRMTLKESLPVSEFSKILVLARKHGGVYSRNEGFVFTNKPDFNKPSSVAKVSAPETKEALAPKKAKKEKAPAPEKPKTVTDIEKKYEENKKNELTKEEKKAVKGIEFEVYPVATFEECEEYLNAWKLALKNRDPEHQDMLDLLIESCREDEELRQYITHKDYLTVFAKGGADFCKKAKRIENNAAEASADEILDDVIAEFKKPVKKVTTKKKEDKK